MPKKYKYIYNKPIILNKISNLFFKIKVYNKSLFLKIKEININFFKIIVLNLKYNLGFYYNNIYSQKNKYYYNKINESYIFNIIYFLLNYIKLFTLNFNKCLIYNKYNKIYFNK